MTNLRKENDAGNETRNAEESVKRKKLPWMRRISTSLEKQTRSGSGRLHHR